MKALGQLFSTILALAFLVALGWGVVVVLTSAPAEAITPNDKARIEARIKATDHQIDALVYELYGLTDEEIEIVEGA